MELGGPLKDAKLLNFVPGPGNYNSNYSTLSPRTSSLRQKLPDVSNRHLLKVVTNLSRIQVLEPMAMRN
jgi:hypothetical protein